MTVRQIIHEIDALSPEDRKEVSAYLSEDQKQAAVSTSPGGVKYLDRQAAQPMIKEILTTHSELFRKLAK